MTKPKTDPEVYDEIRKVWSRPETAQELKEAVESGKLEPKLAEIFLELAQEAGVQVTGDVK